MMPLERLPLIDFWRGVALLGMVLFHFVYDLNFLDLIRFDVWSGWWLFLARFVQVSFMVTTGMTLMFSYQQHLAQGKRFSITSRLKHALKLLIWALMVTGITWVLFGDQAILFGVLHFYAVAVVVALPFLRLGVWNALIGFGILGLNLWLPPLNWFPQAAQALDYFPLIPWFGIFLQGVALADVVLRSPVLFNLFSRTGFRPLEILGRRSLMIYLVHQPILMGVFSLIG